MIDINFNMETASEVKDRLARGYRARRNFLVSELLGMIVFATPVRTGKARGGWQVTIGAPASSDVDNLDQVGFDTVETGLSRLKGASPFSDVYISNLTPYIDDLENGSSTQAPEGMVKVSLSAFKSMNADVI